MNKKMNSKITDKELDNLGCYIDLHLHLDGSISIPSFKRLAQLSGIEVDMSDDELREKMQVPENCKDLNEYLERFALPLSVLQTADAIEESVVTLATELKVLGLIYAEMRFGPALHMQRGLTQREVIEAAIRGVKRSPIPVNLILSSMRDINKDDQYNETIELAAEYLGKGVCAIDLAGAEALFDTSLFGKMFERARELGVPFTIHAGEAAGAESVKCAVEFGAKRIGHGVRSMEDPQVVKLLHDKGITLEMCPKSNVDTKVVKSIADFPFEYYMKNVEHVTINSDDMTVSDTNVVEEFKSLNRVFGLTREEVKELLINSARAAFAPDEIKQILIEKISCI